MTFLKAHERAGYLTTSVTAADRTVEITLDQYRQGVVDFTPVFIFQATLTEEEDQAAVARSDIALGLVRLYRALGGGWEWRLSEEAGEETASAEAAPGGTAPASRESTEPPEAP